MVYKKQHHNTLERNIKRHLNMNRKFYFISNTLQFIYAIIFPK